MAEYITKEALRAYPIRENHCDKEHANEHFILGIESVMEYAEGLPAADVNPVVRCTKCKHLRVDLIDGPFCSHSYGLRRIFRDSFCPYGEYQTNAGGGADD